MGAAGANIKLRMPDLGRPSLPQYAGDAVPAVVVSRPADTLLQGFPKESTVALLLVNLSQMLGDSHPEISKRQDRLGFAALVPLCGDVAAEVVVAMLHAVLAKLREPLPEGIGEHGH